MVPLIILLGTMLNLELNRMHGSKPVGLAWWRATIAWFPSSWLRIYLIRILYVDKREASLKIQ